jgi:Ca-activated chloride channel homolog
VLDRSGSMGDGRLEAAKLAIVSLLGKLDPTDNFGLVAFDSAVGVIAPAGPLTNKAMVADQVRHLYPGSMTNLSGGYFRGIQEARRVKEAEAATLVLLSDGHANEGLTDPAQLEGIAGGAVAGGVATSTIGIGLGYDEILMDGVARSGSGNAHFAEDGDAAGAAIASEVDHLLDRVIQSASITVRPTGDVELVRLFNDLPAVFVEGGFMVELGDFYAGEQRKLLLTIDVPAMPGLGAAPVCELELTYVGVQAMKSETVTVPVNVNVVPGDEAAGRVPNATVRSELAFQRAQETKREAADVLRSGDVAHAARLYGEAGRALDAFTAEAAPEMAGEIADEANLLGDLARRALEEDARWVSRFSESDRHYKARKHGRRRS